MRHLRAFSPPTAIVEYGRGRFLWVVEASLLQDHHEVTIRRFVFGQKRAERHAKNFAAFLAELIKRCQP